MSESIKKYRKIIDDLSQNISFVDNAFNNANRITKYKETLLEKNIWWGISYNESTKTVSISNIDTESLGLIAKGSTDWFKDYYIEIYPDKEEAMRNFKKLINLGFKLES